MMQPLFVSALIALTVAAYLLTRKIYLRYTSPLLNVVLLSAAMIIALLGTCGISYEEYTPAKDIMTFLLGPATVSLAVPLYRNRQLLREYGLPIMLSVLLGSIVSMLTVGFIARLGGLPREVIVSIIPKGVSIPFAIEISRMYGGEPPLAAAFVVATGTLGGVMGAALLTRSGVRNPVARGLAMGTVAHAQGTAMAFMEGEQQGSMAGLAMILAGLVTALLAPFVIRLIV